MVKYLLVFLFIYVLLFIINTNDVEKKMLYPSQSIVSEG